MLLTMLIDTQQQTLVRDDVPPQGRQLWMVGLRHPDLYLTKDKFGQTLEGKTYWFHSCSHIQPNWTYADVYSAFIQGRQNCWQAFFLIEEWLSQNAQHQILLKGLLLWNNTKPANCFLHLYHSSVEKKSFTSRWSYTTIWFIFLGWCSYFTFHYYF